MTQELLHTATTFSSSLSRFDKSALLQLGAVVFFPTYVFRDYPFSPGDLYHQVQAGEEGRLDLISYTYYGTTLLWWVLAEANQIWEPMKGCTPGLTLRIPDPSQVLTVLTR
jgi:hypothetical protein